jgi:hypothetical protein
LPLNTPYYEIDINSFLMAAPAPHLVVFSNLELLPSLRGTLLRDGSSVVIEGQWAMKDADFTEEGQSSPFRLIKKSDLVENITPLCDMTLSGSYEGQLHLKKQSGNGTIIVEEKMILYFEKASAAAETPPVATSGEIESVVPPLAPVADTTTTSNNKYNTDTNTDELTIRGDGTNKFGSFMLKGLLSTGVNAHFYRQYVVPVGGTPKGGKKKSSVKSSSSAVKRDGSSSSASKKRAAPAYVAPPAGPSAPRTQRISQHLIRCGDLIKELKRIPQSVYFLEPVDPVKLNIPEYTEVIKKPMDFSTITKNITDMIYETPLHFAEDVRLVFKNAIIFNQMKDNPVHMAAREMSTIFEQKFAQLNISMQSKQGVTAAELAAFSQRVPKPAAKKKSSSRRSSSSGGGGNRAGYTGKQAALPPDGSYAVMQEMQQRMLDMQNEILALRGSVVEPIYDEGPALTLTEKKRLIDDLGLLGPDDEDTMFEIIAEENDITDGEMDINLIKTSTLRRLQEFVAGIKAAQQAEQAALKVSDPPPTKKSKTEALSQPAQSIVIPSTAIAVADPLSAFAAAPPSIPIAGTSQGHSGGGRERAYSLDLPDYGAMLSDNINEDPVQLSSGDAWVPKEQSEEVRGGSSVTKELMKDEWGHTADVAKAQQEEHG